MSTPARITVTARVAKPIAQVWTCYTEPWHITQWNAANDDWHCPSAENDLRVGGQFSYRMEARDGSFRFNFAGTYTAVKPQEQITYTMDNGRTCAVRFAAEDGGTAITVSFDAETENPVEMQRAGWQAILDRFKRHAETQP